MKSSSGFQELTKRNGFVFPPSYFHSRYFLVKRTMECCLPQEVSDYVTLHLVLLSKIKVLAQENLSSDLLKSLPKFFKLVVYNLCQSSPSLIIYGLSFSLMFLCLSKLLFSSLLQFKGNFVPGQTNTKHTDRAPLSNKPMHFSRYQMQFQMSSL